MPRRRDKERAARAAALYASGMTTRQIGDYLSVSPRTVARWAPGQLRPRGPRPRTSAETDALILELRSGWPVTSFTAIAAETGMSKTGVRMRYYALTGRSRPDRPARKGA